MNYQIYIIPAFETQVSSLRVYSLAVAHSYGADSQVGMNGIRFLLVE